MTIMWVLTRDNMPHVSEQTGYTIEELENILDAYQAAPGRQMTVRIPKKYSTHQPAAFTWPTKGE